MAGSLVSQAFSECMAVSFLDHRSTRCAVLVLLATVLALSIGALAAEADGPPLTVDSPPEGLLTRDWIQAITGTTGPDTPVKVRVEGDWSEHWNETSSLPDGSFEVWTYLDYGNNLVTVEAGAWDTGTTTVTRNITMDRWPPYLEVAMEFLSTMPVPYSEEVGAYVVAEAEVVINGTCYDEFTSREDLLVRTNGEPVVPGPDRRGRFLARVGLEPGLNVIDVDVTDRAGNRRTVTLQVLWDTEPPSLHVHHPVDDEATRDATYMVEGLTEPTTHVKVTVQHPDGHRSFTTTSGAGGAFQVPVQLVEGSQLLMVTVVDAMGNMNSTILAVTLDTTPPDLVIENPPGGHASTREATYAIVARLADGLDAVVSVGGQEVEGMDVFRLEVDLRQGENAFEVRAVDRAGNERVVTVTILRDTFPPTMVLTSPQGADVLTNDPIVPFAGTVGGAVGVTIKLRGVAHQARLTDGSWEDGEWAYDLELSEHDLERDVEVYAHDAAGNRDTVTIHVVLDTVPPPLAIDGGPHQITNRRRARVSGTTEEGLVSLTIDDGRVPVDGGVFDVSVPLVVGVNTLLVCVRDRAGNSACETLEITCDPVPPALELDYPGSTGEGTVVVTGTTDDDVVRVYVDGLAFQVDNGTFAFTIDLVGEGVHEINFTVEDAAGNRRTEHIEIDHDAGLPGFGPLLALLAVAVAALVARLGRRTMATGDGD